VRPPPPGSAPAFKEVSSSQQTVNIVSSSTISSRNAKEHGMGKEVYVYKFLFCSLSTTYKKV
jgi:hypothetical protein